MTNNNYNRTSPTRKFWLSLCMLVAFSYNMFGATAIIGTGGITTTSTGNDPIDGYYNAMRCQAVYLASELSAAGMSAGSVIDGLGYSIAGDYGGGNLGNYTIRMAHTTATNSATHNAAPLTEVRAAANYNPTVTAAGVFDMLTFTTNFTWDGSSNILVDICTGNSNPFTSPYGQVRAQTMTSGSRFVRADGAGSQCAVNTITTNGNRPQIQFNYTSGGVCSGTPTPGNTLSSANPVCSGASFSLSLQNSTVGSGVSYQWYAGDGVTYTPVSGATNSSYTTTQASANYYYCAVTCSAGPNTGNSTPVQVTMNPLLSCYCASTHSSGCSGDAMTSISVNGFTNTTGATCGGSAPNMYLYYTPGVSATTLTAGNSYSLSISFGTDGNQYGAAWIDYNQDGTLDAGEVLGLSGNGGASGTVTINFTVPGSANIGLTRLRIIGGNDSPLLATQACGVSSSSYGETEDYDITIAAPAPCSDPPTAGAAGVSPSAGCAPLNIALNLTGNSGGTGQTYQWEESNDNMNWTPIVGATSNTYNATITASTYYHCVVTCGTSVPSTSVLATINVLGQGDVFADPIPVTTPATLSGNNNASNCWTNAYTTASTPGNATARSTRDVFYSVTTGPCTDSLIIETILPGTLTDTYIHLLAADGTYIEGDDDDGAGNLSVIRRAVLPNTTYVIVVEGYSSEGTWTVDFLEKSNGANSDITGAAIASDDADNRICVLSSVNLSVEGEAYLDGGDNGYVWYAGSCGGTQVGTGTSISVSPTSTTNYYARIEGPCGNTVCVGPFTITVDLAIPAGTAQNSVVPIASCVGETLTVSTPAIVGAAYYNFSAPGGTTFNGGISPAQLSVNSGIEVILGAPLSSGWNICVQGENACGTTINTKCTFIRGTLTQPGAITGNVIACANTSANYSISPIVGADSYVWAITGDATVSGTGTSVTVNYGPTWTGGSLSVKAAIACGTESLPRTLAISHATAQPGVVTGSATACPGATVTYSIPAVSGAGSYNWSACAGATVANFGTTANITFPASFSTCVVTVSANSACGIASASRSKSIANGTPGVPANVVGSFSNLCGSANVAYSCASVAGATSYQWSVLGGSIASGQGTSSITVNWNNSGTTGSLSVAASNVCGTGGTRNVSTRLIPGLPAAISTLTNVVVGDLEAATIPSLGVGVSYNWVSSPAGISVIGNGTNSVQLDYSATAPGVYTLICTPSNTCGNSNNRTISITVAASRQARTAIGTALDAVAYPNPASSELNVKFNAASEGNYSIRMVDIAGRAVMTSNGSAVAGSNQVSLNISQLSAGIYMLNLENGNDRSVMRVVVE